MRGPSCLSCQGASTSGRAHRAPGGCAPRARAAAPAAAPPRARAAPFSAAPARFAFARSAPVTGVEKISGSGPFTRRRAGGAPTGGVRSTSVVVRAVSADPAASMAPASTNPFDTAPLKFEIVQGALVKYSVEEPNGRHPPTAVLIHGILGSRRNLLSFAKRLAQRFPSWQFLLVDLRCHGQTANMPTPPAGANDVTNAAKDVLATLQHLKIYPHSLIGHSFGGKVAMSMVHQFGKQLPRPVQVWVLDTVPGDVWCEAGDHPRDTIAYARTIPMPIANRKALVDSLTGAGFTLEGAQWMTTNLTPAPGATAGELTWVFDIEGIVAMYQSYEATDLWPMLETQPIGLSVDFVRAERSAFVWADEDVGRIGAYGGRVHYLANSSHWVHIDNPDGLLEILAPSFERKK